MSSAPRILAVEPDRSHALALKRFVQSCVDADLLVVDSVASAKSAIADQVPLVVLVSELVSPDDDIELTTHLRSRVPGRPVPILAVPAMGIQDEETPAPRGLMRLIASGGARTDAPRLQMARRQATLRHALQAIVELPLRPASDVATVPMQRPRAPRWKADNIAWLTRVTMPLGLEVRLLNISRSGLLIESRGHFVVGQPAALELHGRLRVVVPGRFVRSTAVGSDGAARYQSAVLFDDDLPLFAPLASGSHRGAAVSSDLGEVLAWVRSQARTGMRADRIRSAFELSVQELVGARAVLICRAPAQADEPGDSVCLPVPTSDGSVAFLQAIYDSTRPPSPHAFEKLQAAATLAADVLEIETTARAADRRH